MCSYSSPKFYVRGYQSIKSTYYLLTSHSSIRSRPRTQFSCSCIQAVSMTPNYLHSAGAHRKYIMFRALLRLPQLIKRKHLSCKTIIAYTLCFCSRIFEDVKDIISQIWKDLDTASDSMSSNLKNAQLYYLPAKFFFKKSTLNSESYGVTS